MQNAKATRKYTRETMDPLMKATGFQISMPLGEQVELDTLAQARGLLRSPLVRYLTRIGRRHLDELPGVIAEEQAAQAAATGEGR